MEVVRQEQGDKVQGTARSPCGWSSKRAWWEMRHQVIHYNCDRDLGSFRHKGKPGEGLEWWEDLIYDFKTHYDHCVKNM